MENASVIGAIWKKKQSLSGEGAYFPEIGGVYLQDVQYRKSTIYYKITIKILQNTIKILKHIIFMLSKYHKKLSEYYTILS